jgi:ABC-2 type transport system permease protein
LLGFLVALAFTGANFISFGIFFSSLTRNQIIAAVLTFAMMLAQLIGFFVKRDFLTPDSPWAVILTHIGFVELWINSTSGKVATRDLLLHFSAAIFWSYLTVKVLESRKWR